ncbi:hypothetical protein CR513_40120, partial [Mucuna pruriens]
MQNGLKATWPNVRDNLDVWVPSCGRLSLLALLPPLEAKSGMSVACFTNKSHLPPWVVKWMCALVPLARRKRMMWWFGQSPKMENSFPR